MILDGKVATPKEEWDYKMALSRAKFAEGQYQNRATHYQGREVASPAPSGGPRRSQPGGGNPKNREEKNQAKQVISQVFDLHGITETQINTDPEGIVTKTEVKTPSTLFDDYRNEEGEPFYSEARESARSSIATPPAASAETIDLAEQERLGKIYQEQRELAGVRDFGVHFGDRPENVSPHYSMELGRYLLNSEYYGTPADHWDSSPINKTVVLNPDTQEFEVQSEADPVINDSGLIWQSDNDMYFAQDRARQDADQRDLLELKDRHPDLFVQMMNEGGFESRPDPHPHAGEGFIENEEGEIVSIEEEELKKNLDDIPWAPDHPLDLEKVVDAIKQEDPSGKAIETLNDFATWADTVPDEVAIREAETYLQGLKDSPTVSQRFRKAMAIAMMAMLFGDDFTTAMNTGFEVVADDYAAEAAAEKEIRDAQIALDKEIAKEERAFERDNKKSHRDYIEALNLKKFELGAKALEDAAAAEALIGVNNQKTINDMADDFWKSLPDVDSKKPYLGINFQGEMAGALDWLNNNVGFRIDFANNPDQAYAFNNTFQEWMEDMKNFKGTPRFEVYVRDMFIKSELSQYKPLNPDLISPSMSYLDKVKVDPKDVNHKSVKESVSTLNEHIQDWAEILGAEKYSIGLMTKDFEDFRKNFPTEFGVLKKSADAKGEGVFTRFVNSKLADAGSLGMNYDPEAKGKTAPEIAALIRAEMDKIDTGKSLFTKRS